MQRALKFAQYLGDFGWEPTVLTITPKAYPVTSTAQIGEIPDSVRVVRCRGFDASRTLSIAGRYPRLVVTPDRWLSWYPDAVRQSRRLLASKQFDAVWSTYPIATAQLIGLRVHAISGLPWVADLRDPMTDSVFPPPGLARRSFEYIERRLVRSATRVTFTAPGTLAMYRERYPDVPDEHWSLIPNGYDESNFTTAEAIRQPRRPQEPLRLLHSGTVYPSERDPTALFRAVANLKQAGRIDEKRLQIVLRASGHDDILGPMIGEADIGDIITLEPPLPYHHALAEMMSVDGSILLQASNCNHQIPAKLYEYLRAGRPVLSLGDPESDTSATIREAGGEFFANLSDADAIANAIIHFIDSIHHGTCTPFEPQFVERCSRYDRTRQLAELLDAMVMNKETNCD